MERCFARLHRIQHGQQQTQHHRPPHHRPCLTSHHARWSAPLSQRRRRYIWYRSSPLEAGGIAIVRLACSCLNLVAVFGSGCHVALPCHRRRGPAIGVSGIPSLISHRYVLINVEGVDCLEFEWYCPILFSIPTNHGGLNSIHSQIPVPLDLVCSWLHDL